MFNVHLVRPASYTLYKINELAQLIEYQGTFRFRDLGPPEDISAL